MLCSWAIGQGDQNIIPKDEPLLDQKYSLRELLVAASRIANYIQETSLDQQLQENIEIPRGYGLRVPIDYVETMILHAPGDEDGRTSPVAAAAFLASVLDAHISNEESLSAGLKQLAAWQSQIDSEE